MIPPRVRLGIDVELSLMTIGIADRKVLAHDVVGLVIDGGSNSLDLLLRNIADVSTP